MRTWEGWTGDPAAEGERAAMNDNVKAAAQREVSARDDKDTLRRVLILTGALDHKVSHAPRFDVSEDMADLVLRAMCDLASDAVWDGLMEAVNMMDGSHGGQPRS